MLYLACVLSAVLRTLVITAIIRVRLVAQHITSSVKMHLLHLLGKQNYYILQINQAVKI